MVENETALVKYRTAVVEKVAVPQIQSSRERDLLETRSPLVEKVAVLHFQ